MPALGTRPLPILRPLSWIYGLGVRARNLSFDIGLRAARRLPVPVVSVGNLSVGGTGKTPFVVMLVELYRARGLRVGVLARGYMREAGEELNDEGRMLARRFPGLPQRQGPDRYAAGMELCAEHALDVIVLDDGFQHRRLHRDLDICLIYAPEPFGGLLPAGWLREPVRSLRRADLCVLTNAQECTEAELARLRQRVTKLCGGREPLVGETVATEVVALPGPTISSVNSLHGQRVHLLAAIAAPLRFLRTAKRLGADVVHSNFLRDHSTIPPKVWEQAADDSDEGDAILVITEKDEARCGFSDTTGPKRNVLRIAHRFVDEPDPGMLLPEGV